MMSRHSDIAAYALGVLDEGAQELFEEHLSNCTRCRREIVEFDAIPRVLQQGAQLGLFAQTAARPPNSDERRPQGRCVPVRCLVFIAASLVVLAAAAVLAIAQSLPAGLVPADNHLSWCGGPLTSRVASVLLTSV
jgi:anti-sigma factor RsiW